MRIRIQSNLYNESLRLGTRALALFFGTDFDKNDSERNKCTQPTKSHI
jgi:hypothetical protein